MLSTIHDDGSADFTITIDGEHHKFSASSSSSNDDETAVLSYEETLSWRGEIRSSEPSNDVFKQVMQSDEAATYLDQHELTSIRRERHD